MVVSYFMWLWWGDSATVAYLEFKGWARKSTSRSKR